MVTLQIPSWFGFSVIVLELVFFACCVYIGRPQKPVGLNEPWFMAALERGEEQAEQAEWDAECKRLADEARAFERISAMREMEQVAAWAWHNTAGEDEAQG